MDAQLILLTIIGIFAATLGTLVGGGGLITLPAMMLFGIPIHTGIATNKFSTAVGTFTSLIYLLRKGDVTIREIIMILSISLTGGVSGALLTTQITEKTMNWVALVLLIFAFLISLNNKSWVSSATQKETPNRRPSKMIPFFIGAYDGGFGPGATTFAIIHYLKRNQTYIKSVQYSRALIFGSGFGAFIVYAQTSFFSWHYAIALAIGSIIGSQIGLAILPHVPIRIAKFLLTSILVLLIAEVSFKLI